MLSGPDSAADSEIKAVFRISKPFLDDIVGKHRIVADIPFTGTVIGLYCTGTIHGEATPKLELKEQGRQALIEVTSQGNGSAPNAMGTRGPVVVSTPMWGPFATRTLIQFDGQQFAHVCTSASIDLDGCLAQIRGRHGRRFGEIVGRGMQPFGEKMMPRAIDQAKPLAEKHVRDWVECKAAEVIAKLNRTTPIRQSIHRLFPETTHWGFHVSAQAEFLQAAYGPLDSQVPTLRHTEDFTADVHVELWLKSSGDEAQLLADLSRRPLAKQLIATYLEATLPELAAIGTERSVAAIDDWMVVRVGVKPSDE